MGARSRFGAATSASNRLNSSVHRCASPLGSWLPCALRPSTHRIGCNPVRGPLTEPLVGFHLEFIRTATLRAPEKASSHHLHRCKEQGKFGSVRRGSNI